MRGGGGAARRPTGKDERVDLDLDGKSFLVLGASRGLGRAVAAALAAEGAHVVVAARDETAIGAVADALGDRGHPLALDVAAADAADRAAAAVEQHLGGRLDGLLVNSGGPPPGHAMDLDDDAWESAYALLVTGPMRLLRRLVPLLRAPASILWVTSTSVRQPIAGLDTSNLLRPGIAALCTSLARELGPDVRVNSIAPGRFDTDRVRELDEHRAAEAGVSPEQQRQETAQGIPLGRYGDPAELGRTAAFLLSPAASYISGVSLQVDGGLVTAVP
jgi:3-oxoacyl-[acyl-carrier protein] reductase